MTPIPIVPTSEPWTPIPIPPVIPPGILCPVCLTTKHKITSTTKVPGAIKRNRLCINGHNFPTFERTP